MKITAIAAGLVAGAAVLAAAGPASAASVAPAAPPPPPAASVAPAPANEATASGQDPLAFTLGTSVEIRNNTGGTIYVSEYDGFDIWRSWVPIPAGATEIYAGDYPLIDDVELKVKTRADGPSIDVDAENPAYSTPWMSVDWDSEYFSVGGNHTWYLDNGGVANGHRHSDSDHYKRFELTFQKGW